MKKKLFGVAVLALLALGLCGTGFGATIYIPDDYPTIQEGIDAAVSGSTVIVKDGTYLLTAALDFKGKAITVKSENGAENCILDGQQQTRVVYFHSGETKTSVLSGFVIRNGQADKGGGINCDSSSPTISNCSIIANKAYLAYASYGGGIYCKGASPIITNCTISGNSAESYAGPWDSASSHGGGIYCKGGSPTITSCTVSGNTALASGGYPYSYGGGIYCDASSPIIASSTFSNNSTTATYDSLGGGMFFTASFPSVVNTIMNGNSAKLGAGIYFSSSSGSFTNCTIVRNTSPEPENDGGLYCANSSPTIVNSILYDNNPNQIFKGGTSNPTVTYSDVEGGYDGAANIDENPNFKDIANKDFHLKATSPCIDVGDNDAPELPAKDRDGKPRIVNGTVDMGAYEYQVLPKPPVIISFTAKPTSGPPQLTVEFTCIATDPDGNVAKYVWDFGDGTQDETADGTISHTYQKIPINETLFATVTVFDDDNKSTTSKAIPIRPVDGPNLSGKAEEYVFSDLTKTISIKFRVTNSGNVAAGPFKVTFHLSNNGSNPLAAFKEVQVDGLAVKKNTLLTVDNTFDGSIYGKYILIYIDPDKELPEINETNNGTRIVVQSVATK